MRRRANKSPQTNSGLRPSCLSSDDDLALKTGSDLSMLAVMTKTSWLGSVGIVGVTLSVALGCYAGGFNPVFLFHIPEMIIVFGVTFFCMLLSFRGALMRYLVEGSLAIVTERKADRSYYRMSQAGIRYAMMAGGVGLLPAGMPILLHLSAGSDYIGPRVCAMFTAVVWSLLLSQVVFRNLALFFMGDRRSPERILQSA